MSTPLAALIVDDEPPARRALERLVAQTDNVEVVGTAGDGLEALEVMATARVDLLLADINMPGLAGLELADRLIDHAPPVVVFVTAYAEHAVRAFELGVADYLLKPVAPERLALAVDRARTALTLMTAAPAVKPFINRMRRPAAPNHMWTHAVGARARVAVNEIELVRAEGDYVRIVTTCGDTRLADGPLDRLGAVLADAGFLRVHRSTLVRLDAVRAVRSDPSRRLLLEMRSGEVVAVGRRATPHVRTLLRHGSAID